MTTQEILKELKKNDKVAIRGILRDECNYSDSYISRLFSGQRTHTRPFLDVVRFYWEKKQEIVAAIN